MPLNRSESIDAPHSPYEPHATTSSSFSSWLPSFLIRDSPQITTEFQVPKPAHLEGYAPPVPVEISVRQTARFSRTPKTNTTCHFELLLTLVRFGGLSNWTVSIHFRDRKAVNRNVPLCKPPLLTSVVFGEFF
jgi:hypothetical protein